MDEGEGEKKVIGRVTGVVVFPAVDLEGLPKVGLPERCFRVA